MIADQIFSQITQRRAEVLREVARGKTFKEGAMALGITVRAFQHHVTFLEHLTGQPSKEKLGQWWRESRAAWIEHLRRAAGANEVTDAS